MIKYYTVIIVGLLLLITGCATTINDIKVSAKTDPKAKLSGYQTYAWLASAKILYDPKGKWEPPQFDADAEVKWLIDRELRKQDRTEVDANPDMIVGYAAGIDMDALKLVKDPETKFEVLQNIPQGGLVIILIDASTGYPIWAGVAEADIQQDPTTELVRKRLDYAVRKMFQLLPRW
jgi:hypothetical protein